MPILRSGPKWLQINPPSERPADWLIVIPYLSSNMRQFSGGIGAEDVFINWRWGSSLAFILIGLLRNIFRMVGTATPIVALHLFIQSK